MKKTIVRKITSEDFDYIFKGIEVEDKTGFRLHKAEEHETARVLRLYVEVTQNPRKYAAFTERTARHTLLHLAAFWKDYFTLGEEEAVAKYWRKEEEAAEEIFYRLYGEEDVEDE